MTWKEKPSRQSGSQADTTLLSHLGCFHRLADNRGISFQDVIVSFLLDDNVLAFRCNLSKLKSIVKGARQFACAR